MYARRVGKMAGKGGFQFYDGGVPGTGGRYGHMDMYPYKLEIYKVEAVRRLVSFRSLP